MYDIATRCDQNGLSKFSKYNQQCVQLNNLQTCIKGYLMNADKLLHSEITVLYHYS